VLAASSRPLRGSGNGLGGCREYVRNLKNRRRENGCSVLNGSPAPLLAGPPPITSPHLAAATADGGVPTAKGADEKFACARIHAFPHTVESTTGLLSVVLRASRANHTPKTTSGSSPDHLRQQGTGS